MVEDSLKGQFSLAVFFWRIQKIKYISLFPFNHVKSLSLEITIKIVWQKPSSVNGPLTARLDNLKKLKLVTYGLTYSYRINKLIEKIN